jgi:hypothetical protein
MRYQNEMQQVEEQGYFVNEDGVKSTDMKKKVKRTRSPINEVSVTTKKQKIN